MQLSAKEAWNRVLDAARGELPDQSIQSWLAPTEPMALEGGRLVLGAPDEFAVQWNENKHAPLLTRLASSVLETPTEVVFKVLEDRKKRPQMDFFVAPPRGLHLGPGPPQPQYAAAQRAIHV